MALAFPPLSCETMHLQQAWFQLYLAHHPEISAMFLVVPHGQLPHFPLGQLPPQVSANARARTRQMRTMSFMNKKMNITKEIYNFWI
jgi:hypothetical protein